MLAWECTYEEELEIRTEEAKEEGIEEGIFESAMRLLANGMAIQDVVRMLRLTDVQASEVKVRANMA